VRSTAGCESWIGPGCKPDPRVIMKGTEMGLVFRKGEKVVLIGDSITACKRSEIELGGGYVRLVASLLGARYPELGLSFVNKGVSGDNVLRLAARWETDVIAEKPDWLSVSIGINDASLEEGKSTQIVAIDAFEETYRRLLNRTKEAVGSRLILMETTVSGESLTGEENRRLAPYNKVIRKLAKEFDAVLVPMNREWHKALKASPGVKWTGDGGHPNPAGHGLMAKVWLDAVGFEW